MARFVSRKGNVRCVMKGVFKCFPDHVPTWVWDQLSNCLKRESSIMQSRVSPEQLEEVYRKGFAVIYVTQEIVHCRQGEIEFISGFLAAWPVEPDYCEIGSAWVDPDLRGTGIGHKLYLELAKLPNLKTRTNFGITMNPISVHLGRYARLELYSDWKHPVPWRLTCGPCDYVAECDKESCVMRNTTCWLRVMKK